jgi:hypothetical protein
MPRVFISHNPNYDSSVTRCVADVLGRIFGSENVVKHDKPLTSSTPNYQAILRHAIRACDATLVIIGPRWHDLTESQRYEIATALNYHTTVIPVLVSGATMPKHLPTDLAALAEHSAITLRDRVFDQDLNRLVRMLRLAIFERENDPTLYSANASQDETLIIPGNSRNRYKPSVFISYRRSPSAMLATLLYTQLGLNGIRTFLDTRKLDGGGPFPERLLNAIEECEVFVCLLARSTLDSEWVRREIEHAYLAGKPMIPVFQESFEPPQRVDSAAVAALLECDGIHILDVKNLYIDYAIDDLATMIRATQHT